MRQIRIFTRILGVFFVLLLSSNYAFTTTESKSKKITKYPGQTLRFVVASDCRAPKGDANKKFPDNLYNRAVLTAINQQITTLDPIPEFVMFLGDMVNFASPNAGDNPNAINNLVYWKNFMTAGLDGIPLYVCVGNSDLYGQTTWWTEEARQTEFAQVFSNLPDNGPTTPVDFRHLVYSFELGEGNAQSLFVVLDSFGIYGSGATAKHCDNDFDPYPYPPEQMDWFTEQAQNSDAPNKFVFSHGPAFSVMGYPVNRNVKKVWDTAMTYDFNAFFCAHEHLYYRWLINKDAYPTAAGDLLQILTGSSGAVPDSPLNVLSNPNYIFFGYTFVVVDVDITSITIQTYAVVKNGSAYITELIDKYVILKPKTITIS